MPGISHDDIVAAFQEIEKHDLLLLPKQYSPYSVSLVNETDLDGPVHFIGTDGVPRLVMHQDDYIALKDWAVKNLESPVRKAIREETELQSLLDHIRYA
jgi:hypothetical protein